MLPNNRTPTKNIRHDQPTDRRVLSEGSLSDSELDKPVRARIKNLNRCILRTSGTVSDEKSAEIRMKILRDWSTKSLTSANAELQATLSCMSVQPPTVSDQELAEIKDFVFESLSKLPSDSVVNYLLKLWPELSSSLDQCFGRSTMIMGVKEVGLLESMRLEIQDLPFIQNNPLFQKLYAAIQGCSQRAILARKKSFAAVAAELNACLHRLKEPKLVYKDQKGNKTLSLTHKELSGFMDSARSLLGFTTESEGLDRAQIYQLMLLSRHLIFNPKSKNEAELRGFMNIAIQYAREYRLAN